MNDAPDQTSRERPRVLILGGGSDMGRAIAHAFASQGAAIVLAGRSAQRLDADAQDIHLRYGVEASTVEFDVLRVDRHGAFLDDLGALPDTVVCVVGLLGDQTVSASEAVAARLVMDTNYTTPALLLGEIANRMERRGHGLIIGISSVAGERGRASNYVYGSAKAGLTAFLSGLRARLSRTPVRVMTVKPGFVATRMTQGLKLPPLLTAQPEEVASAVLGAARKGRDVVYVRGIWALIMAVIRAVPEFVFKKMKF